MKTLIQRCVDKPFVGCISLIFEPKDIWIGLYWNHTKNPGNRFIDLYVCVIPMIALKIRIWPERKNWALGA